METDKLGNLGTKYIIFRKLGKGGTSEVYLSEMPSNTNDNEKIKVALKILNKDTEGNDSISETAFKEYEVLKQLESPYILNVFDYGIDHLYLGTNTDEIRNYIALEYAGKGDLFRFLPLTEKNIPEGLEDEYARPIFKNILLAVKVCHDNGFCHRDIKIENIMVNDDYMIKLSDFGYASKINSKAGKLNTYCGTKIYMAPEIVMEKPYDGKKADVFSLGVTLFSLLFGVAPFDEASTNDKRYLRFINKKLEGYWKSVSKFCQRNISPELKDLIQRMFEFKSDKRITIDEILNHPWMTMESASPEALIRELKERNKKFEAVSINESESEGSEHVYRGDEEGQRFDEKQVPIEGKYLFEKETCILVNEKLNPSMILSKLVSGLQSKYASAEISTSEKLLEFMITFTEKEKKCTFEIEDDEEEEIPKEEDQKDEDEEDDEEEENHLKINIAFNKSSEDNTNFINLFMTGGDRMDFMIKVKEIKEIASHL
ncbi:MAG: serine/threonine-protein kinase [archaeon]|nr:serine/threonine-protein kinase [archaeon]